MYNFFFIFYLDADKIETSNRESTSTSVKKENGWVIKREERYQNMNLDGKSKLVRHIQFSHTAKDQTENSGSVAQETLPSEEQTGLQKQADGSEVPAPGPSKDSTGENMARKSISVLDPDTNKTGEKSKNRGTLPEQA